MVFLFGNGTLVIGGRAVLQTVSSSLIFCIQSDGRNKTLHQPASNNHSVMNLKQFASEMKNVDI